MQTRVARALAQVLLAVVAGIVVSWLGVVALVALSILWPDNQVLHVLLGVWLSVITAYLVPPLLPGRQLGSSDNWPKRIAYAPLIGPILWIVLGARQTESRTKGRPGGDRSN